MTSCTAQAPGFSMQSGPIPSFLLFHYRSQLCQIYGHEWLWDTEQKTLAINLGGFGGDCFPEGFYNLILIANPMKQKYRNYTHGDKKNWTKTSLLLVEASLLLRKERKFSDEKIKALLNAISNIVATWGCWALEMWLILIEMYRKF